MGGGLRRHQQEPTHLPEFPNYRWQERPLRHCLNVHRVFITACLARLSTCLRLALRLSTLPSHPSSPLPACLSPHCTILTFSLYQEVCWPGLPIPVYDCVACKFRNCTTQPMVSVLRSLWYVARLLTLTIHAQGGGVRGEA